MEPETATSTIFERALGKPSCKKKFLSGIARITSPPPSPQFGQLVPLFLGVKNDVLARIREPSNDDYDNDVSDNCDNNFGTFWWFWPLRIR